MMSSTGVAHGYDVLRYGESFHRKKDGCGDYPVMEITKGGVQFLVTSERERAWIEEVEHSPQRHVARQTIVREWNWTRWKNITPKNREFMLSLLWVPADPLSAMEILAIAASD